MDALQNYTDTDGRPHYVTRLAQVNAAGDVMVEAATDFELATRQYLREQLEQLDLYQPGDIKIKYGITLDQIPDGWALCDGTQGTPDLRGAFIVGAGNRDADPKPGDTGGKNEIKPAGSVKVTVQPHTLTKKQMPWHQHLITKALLVSLKALGYDGPIDGSSTASKHDRGLLTSSTDGEGGGESHAHGGTGEFTGTTQDNRPRFYALIFIMKLNV